MKVKPILIGAIIGAAAGFFMGKGSRGGEARADYSSSAGAKSVTGKFAQPFQWGIDKGR